MNNRKLRIGWFTFTCCEDSTIIFTELLNTHFEAWLPRLDFVHAKFIKSHNAFAQMDVAFIEGAITSETQAEKLKKIRSLATKLIAVGACACIAMPGGQRNTFDEKTNQEIDILLTRFKYSKRVQKIDELVKVDGYVQGCPMDEKAFIALLEKSLTEFGIT